MKKIKSVIALLLALVLMVGVFAGCGKKVETTEEPSTAPEASPEAGSTTEKALKVAYVTAGAQGDNGFTDSVCRGMARIQKDFGAETKIIENNNDSARFAQSIEACFQWGPDVVFADAYGFEELFAQYADKYPDVIMVNLDFVITNEKNTVSSVTFIAEEGAFLAGVLAAKATASSLEYANADKKVGFVGGKEITVIKGFLDGFQQGVAYVDPSIEVLVSYVGDFFDPVKGKQAANQLYAQGADIIFQAAGQSGNGVLEAASESKKYVIGVDSNQNGTYPGFVVSSMIKDLDGAVYDVFSQIADGSYKPGNVYEKHAGPGGCYLAIDDFSKDILPAEMVTEIEGIQNDIVSGKIKVERYTEE